MLAYFTGSVSAKHNLISHYLKIIDVLKQANCKVISDHILEATEESIKLLSKEERLQYHDKVTHWIHSSDFIVAETSYPSTSVGYEIALALRVGKPVLLLYSVGDPPTLLGQHKDEKLVVEKYEYSSIKTIVNDFIAYVQGRHDLRFTFFITPRIITYLDYISKKNKVPKSVYLRNLIEDDMDKNSY